MISFLRDPKDDPKSLVDLINTSGRVWSTKLTHTQKAMTFLYTNDFNTTEKKLGKQYHTH